MGGEKGGEQGVTLQWRQVGETGECCMQVRGKREFSTYQNALLIFQVSLAPSRPGGQKAERKSQGAGS
jgi:hypothetical protein